MIPIEKKWDMWIGFQFGEQMGRFLEDTCSKFDGFISQIAEKFTCNKDNTVILFLANNTMTREIVE